MVAGRKLHSVALDRPPEAYLADWRETKGTLFIPALSDARIGEEVAARIGISGQAIRATLHGSVSLVRKVGRPALPPGVEITLDRASLPAARFLAAAARGEPVTFRERAPRYMAAERLHVKLGSQLVGVTTLNVSEGGCALAWPAPPPAAGDVFPLRLGEGLFAPSARGVVCWVTAEGEGHHVGLRVLAEGRGERAWRALASRAARSGVRVA